MELVLVAPLLILFVLLVVALGRLVQAKLRVDDAAYQAARAASLARNAGAARAQAVRTAQVFLSEHGSSCLASTVVVDLGDFRAGGHVSVHVACVTSLTRLSKLRLPGHQNVASDATAPVDRYRSLAVAGSSPPGRRP